ncbi:hypothetical protein PISMIDRAFT_545678 [Pisolithus microcarpus 441]|uniref:Uncharacterized protein n=1 Tax=Pisolithus microcarpus 441 TaxID=765257 RepID=A0A0C9YXD1_9AGAM|nr:hypothetical protein PISMIDRAFT_545678 [Pisolithus microcarpus 441]
MVSVVSPTLRLLGFGRGDVAPATANPRLVGTRKTIPTCNNPPSPYRLQTQHVQNAPDQCYRIENYRQDT